MHEDTFKEFRQLYKSFNIEEEDDYSRSVGYKKFKKTTDLFVAVFFRDIFEKLNFHKSVDYLTPRMKKCFRDYESKYRCLIADFLQSEIYFSTSRNA